MSRESKNRGWMEDLELTVQEHASTGLGYVAGFALGDHLLVAVGGTSSTSPMVLASSDARHFEPRKTPRQLGLRDVLVVDDVLWVCGEYGQLAISRDTGATWRVIDTGTDACLFALARAPDGAVWVVGDHGYAARVVGERVERVSLGTSARLAAVYALREELVVLGCDGVVYRWRDGEVVRSSTGASRPLTALALTRLGSWILVGDGGFIGRSPDGAWWSRVKSGAELDLEAVCTLADGRLVAVGDRGTILISSDDGRTWTASEHDLDAHLWSVQRFGPGVLIGGDRGLVAKLAPVGDQTWHDRINVFGGAQPLDAVFAAGPDGFIATRLPAYLRAVASQPTADALAVPPELPARFAAVHGVPLPPEAGALLSAAQGHDKWSSFEELRLDAELVPDTSERNLFELLVERDQRAYLGTGLVDAFCGVFCLGSQGNGDTYHMELYEWDGPRQLLHFDHETHAFTGVIADSLDSLVYLAALERARESRQLSEDAFAIGLRKLRGKIAPTWHFAVDEHDPGFVALDPKRRDSELFFYRSRWICALLKNDGVTEIDDIPRLFNADFNGIVPEDQLPARYDACEKFIPTALYSMWRAFLFDEPELARYLEIGRRHQSRLVRDAAQLIAELCAGRNHLGTIHDVRAHLAAFRALDLDPRRADQRRIEADARARAAAARRHEIASALEHAPQTAWVELAWRWLHDGTAHRALVAKLATTPELAAQLAALEELRAMPDAARELAVPGLATALAPELEAVLVGSIVRNDPVLVAPAPANCHRGGRDDVERVRAALAMTDRALRIAPADDDTQLTHAMLLLDADRVGIAGRLDELLCALPGYSVANLARIAARMGALRHPRFTDALDAALAARELHGVDDDVLADLGIAAVDDAPERALRLVPLLPARVNLLSSLAWEAIQAGHRDAALALYDRLLDMPVPDDGGERTNYLRAMNNACVQAHAAKAYEAAVRIADRAQPYAHENPYLYHSAACAYAALGDYGRAFEQVELAVEHDYDHLGKIEVDADLGPLLEWPEFKALFRDWRARQEGN